MKVKYPQFLGNRVYRVQIKDLHFSSQDRTVKTSKASVPKSIGILHYSKAYTGMAYETADVSDRRETANSVESSNPTVFIQNTIKMLKILLTH
jgi:hypothetical protein